MFPGARVAVFVDGCFWHGCPEHYVRPRTSNSFWSAKLSQNVSRDEAQTAKLEALGWRVCRLWEHDVFTHPGRMVRQLTAAVRDPVWRPSTSWRVFRVDTTGDHGERECRHLRELRNPSRTRVVERARSTKKWSDRSLELSMRRPVSRSA